VEESERWERDLDSVWGKASKEGKLVLLDFFNPECGDCRRMDAVTYPTDQVKEWLNRTLVPVRVSHEHEPLAEEFRVVRTPCLVLLDRPGREVHRSEGFLSPGDFLAFVQLGLAKLKYERAELESAMDLLQGLFKNHPESPSLAEAVVVRGRCRYRYTHDPRHLREAHEQLRSDFPGSGWVRRTLQYRLL